MPYDKAMPGSSKTNTTQTRNPSKAYILRGIPDRYVTTPHVITTTRSHWPRKIMWQWQHVLIGQQLRADTSAEYGTLKLVFPSEEDRVPGSNRRLGASRRAENPRQTERGLKPELSQHLAVNRLSGDVGELWDVLGVFVRATLDHERGGEASAMNTFCPTDLLDKF
jgi:hypothetical protein